MDQNIPGNFDDYSHGTHVASIAGGRRYGIAKGVREDFCACGMQSFILTQQQPGQFDSSSRVGQWRVRLHEWITSSVRLDNSTNHHEKLKTSRGEPLPRRWVPTRRGRGAVQSQEGGGGHCARVRQLRGEHLWQNGWFKVRENKNQKRHAINNPHHPDTSLASAALTEQNPTRSTLSARFPIGARAFPSSRQAVEFQPRGPSKWGMFPPSNRGPVWPPRTLRALPRCFGPSTRPGPTSKSGRG